VTENVPPVNEDTKDHVRENAREGIEERGEREIEERETEGREENEEREGIVVRERTEGTEETEIEERDAREGTEVREGIGRRKVERGTEMGEGTTKRREKIVAEGKEKNVPSPRHVRRLKKRKVVKSKSGPGRNRNQHHHRNAHTPGHNQETEKSGDGTVTTHRKKGVKVINKGHL